AEFDRLHGRLSGAQGLSLLLPACGEKVGMRGPLRQSEPAETPPHRAEFWFSSVPRGPLPASGARNAVCPPPIPQPEKMCAQASPERGRLAPNWSGPMAGSVA